MSNVINFDARKFKFDRNCQSNAGSRMFKTDESGNNVETFVIGDWQWSWTQIDSVKKVSPNTDYVFRFAMNGGYNDTDDAVSQLIIVPQKEVRTHPDEWEERYTYALARSEYRPVISKRWGDGLLRVFEMPFNSGEYEYYRVMFIAQHAVATIMPANDNESYASMADLTYDQWWNERHGGVRGYSEHDRLIRGFKDKLGDFFSAADGASISQAGMRMAESVFAQTLRGCGDGCHIDLSGCEVCSDEYSVYIDIGGQSDGSNIDASNCDMTARALSMLMRKIGDGCNVDLSNCCISAEGLSDMYDTGSHADGVNIDLSNSRMPQRVYDLIRRKLGDGCNISMENAEIIPDNEMIGSNVQQYNEFARHGIETAYASLKAQYDAAPEGSGQRNALKMALAGLEAQMRSFDKYAEAEKPEELSELDEMGDPGEMGDIGEIGDQGE